MHTIDIIYTYEYAYNTYTHKCVSMYVHTFKYSPALNTDSLERCDPHSNKLTYYQILASKYHFVLKETRIS